MLIAALWVGAFPVIPGIAGARSAPLPWSCSTSSVVVAKMDAKQNSVRVLIQPSLLRVLQMYASNCQNPMKAAASDGDDSNDEEFDEEFEEFA